MKLSKQRKIVFLFAALFLFYSLISGSFSIYREIKGDTISLNIFSGDVTVTFDANGGTIPVADATRTVSSGSLVGTLPTTMTRVNHTFDGWWTEAEGGTKITSQTVVTGNTVRYYAHWIKMVCKKAVTGTLHTETCDSTGSCTTIGYSANDTITYGTIPGNNSPIIGDAYDCDVNDDDVWDPLTERFYYVRSYGGTSQTDNSVLVHFTSFDSQGQMDSSSSRLNYIYEDALNYLPTSATWDNPALIEMNGNITRFISREDVAEACGSNTGGNKFRTCQFYLENTRFQSINLGRAGLWILEEGSNRYRIHTETLTLASIPTSDSKNAARPTIEIPSNTIEDFKIVSTYTITFNPTDGTLDNPNEATRSVSDGNPIGTLPAATRSNYVLEGWYTDATGGTKINANTLATGNDTYYAHWKQVELDYVFYIPGECTFTSTGITDGTNGDCISTVNPTGSNIDYTDSALSAKKYIDTGISLYGTTYHDYNYEIHFEIVDYDPEINESQATFFNTKREGEGYPGVVVRRGTNQNKLKIELASRKTSGNNESVMLDYATVTKVSIFRLNNEIYYKLNDNDKVLMNNLSQYNPEFTLTTWFGGGPVDKTATTAQRYLIGTLKNMYIKVAPNNNDIATVTFDPNYQGASTFDEEYTKGEAIGTLPTPTRSGYTLLGWFTDSTNGTQITENTIVNDDITYYAHWHENVTVTLHANEGTVSPNTITIPYNSAVGTIPTPERSGYTFAGWYTDDNTFQNEVTSATVITANTDFYAKWIENITVTLNAKGGTVTPSSITFASGTEVGTLPTPEKNGYDFKGWFTDDETFQNEVTSVTVFNTGTIIYAKWEETTNITINLDADGGTVSPTSISIPPGTKVGTLPTPTNTPDRTNYTFVSWFIDDGTYQNEVTSTTILNEDTNLIAKWVDDSYVACIGSNCYTTLAAAVNAVPTTGVKTTIKIIQDITNTAVTIIPSSKWVELDIGEHTISISNGTTNLFSNEGKFDIINGTLYSSAGYIIYNKANSTLNISGGTLTFDKSSDSEHKVIEMMGGTINISGGTLNCNSKAAVINANGGTLNVTGGRIIGTNTFKGQAIYNNGATTTISGDAYLENTSTTNVTNGRAALHNNSGTVNVLGGTIISNQNAAVKNNGIMTIGTNDGTIDTTSPVFQGHTYGLETVTGKTVTVYDGIFKGKVSTNNKAISNESVVDKGTYTIVHDSETIDNVQYDVAYLKDNSVSITLNFNVNGGDSVSLNTITLNAEGPIGNLPTATKANTEFLGWYTAQTGGERVLTTRDITTSDNGIIYYAHYTNATTVCKPATTLHTDGNTTFGTIPTSSSLSSGNAFDCDVNGDGTFDSTNERFYYLTDTSDGKAVLIYSNNVHQGQGGVTPMCKADAVAYGDNFTEGPTTAITELPTTTEWKNVSLYTEPRTITNQSGTTITSDYIYTEKAARLANLDEIKAATSSSINETTNELASYSFLLENTASFGDCRSNYWLETTHSSGGAVRINAATANKSLGHATGSSAVRPVIEVPYSSIEGAINIVEFDTIPEAMRTYFNNVNTWNSGQDDSNYSSFDSAMVNNLNNYNCVYYQNDNTATEYGSVYCDQPNKYDTGITGNINVYEYNPLTGETSNTIASYVSNDNGKLYNFVPGKTYYWESATDSSKNGYVKPTGERRLITIPGTNRQTRNIRDLGGLPVDTDGNGTIDGKIKYQKLYRGEKIWGTNRDGTTKAQFEKLGIYNELDLRTQGSEIVTSEEDQLTNYIPYEIIHYKIDHTEFGSPAIETQFNGKSYYQLARDSAIDVMKRVVEGNDDYALYFHCRIGADRTGTLAYILEGLLGVPTEYRHQDYELTTFFGLRERTRYYYNKGDNYYKFLYLKKSIRHATPNNNETTGEENVMDWFLLEGNSTTECNDITTLINQFRAKMIDYN